MPAGSAPDVEHSVTRREPQRTNNVVNFLRSALGERVPQIRLAHVVGQVLEPVSVERRVRHGLYFLAFGRSPRVAPGHVYFKRHVEFGRSSHNFDDQVADLSPFGWGHLDKHFVVNLQDEPTLDV